MKNIEKTTEEIFFEKLVELLDEKKITESVNLIDQIPNKTLQNYSEICPTISLLTSIKEVELTKKFIDKVLIPGDPLVCLDILQGVINFRDPNDEKKSVLEILKYMLDSGIRVDGVNQYGKDAIQTAAQQKHEIDGEIVKILLKTKQAPRLEGEISDFVLFLIESKKVNFVDLEKKEFFLEENKMNKFLQDYSEERLLDKESLTNLYEKIKQNYGIDYQREAKEIVTESTSYKNLSEIKKLNGKRDAEPSSTIKLTSSENKQNRVASAACILS